MRKIIVSGATSMLGVATIQAALEDHVDKIYAIVRENTGRKNRLPEDERIIPVECSLGQYDRLKDLIGEPCDTFYHFAWEASQKERSQRYFDVEVGYRNVGYALQAYEAAVSLHCRNFVGAGSQAEYGNARREVQRPDDPTDPVTCYGIAKDQVRRFLMIKSRETDTSVQWVRIFSVYGKNDKPATLISSTIRKILAGETIPLTAATQVWDYLYESDAGKAIYLVGRDVSQNEIFCVGSGDSRPLKDYLSELQQAVDHPAQLLFGQVPYGKDAVMNLHPDISQLKEKTSWEGPEVSFQEGIRMICESLQ